jgi:hypothetical protein
MNTRLKVILTAVTVAILASPAMAEQTDARQHSTEISRAHGSAHGQLRAHARVTETPVHMVRPGQPLVQDCIHVEFPQCGGDPDQATR